MAYEVVLKPSVAKAMDALPPAIFRRVMAALARLEQDPRPTGVVKLKGDENLWRIRVGAYRVVYEVHDDQLLVLVLRVAHRKDVYRGM